MWVKTTCCKSSQSSFNKKFLLQQFYIGAVLYQYTCFYLQKATTFSRSPASPRRELQPPQLLYQLMYQYVGASLQKAITFSFLLGTMFHKFSNWIHKYKIITTTIQSLTLNHPTTKSLKPCHQNTVTRTQTRAQNSATTTRTNNNLKYQIS